MQLSRFLFLASAVLALDLPDTSQKPKTKCLGPVFSVPDPWEAPPFARPMSGVRPPESEYVPYKVYFLLDDRGVSPESMQKLIVAQDHVNRRLGRVIKTSKLLEGRYESIPNENSTGCQIRLMCSKLPLEIPPEWVNERCSIKTDPNPNPKPNPPSPAVREVIDHNHTVIVHVVVAPSLEDPTAVAEFRKKYENCIEGVNAFAGPCALDSNTGRPTHGFIVYCKDPATGFGDFELEGVTLHETMHIVIPSLVPAWDPFYKCPPNNDLNKFVEECPNLSKSIERDWMNPSGQVSRKKSFLVTTDRSIEAARAHFNCPELEGLEASYGVRPDGIIFGDFSHWSQRLFPDEILAPTEAPSQSLSSLTLSAVASHVSWYKVDTSLAEPLRFSRPPPESGCDHGTKSCYEILKEHRNGKPPRFMQPYCDNVTSEERIISTRCSTDQRHRLFCRSDVDDCPVLSTDRGVTYDHSRCDSSKILDKATEQLGGTLGSRVGENSICVTFTHLSSKLSLFPICVLHECLPEKWAILLKYQPTGSDRECYVECSECELRTPVELDCSSWRACLRLDRQIASFIFSAQSNQLMNFTNPTCPSDILRHFVAICPDYQELCGSSMVSTPPASFSTDGSKSSDSSQLPDGSKSSLPDTTSQADTTRRRSDHQILLLCFLCMLRF